MKRALIDLSSVLWTCLLAGKDKEFGRTYVFEDKEIFVNSADFGYENAINHLKLVMEDIGLQPHQLIFVPEGMNSKNERRSLLNTYKAGRDRHPAQYEQFNACKERVLQTFLDLGAQACWQDHGVEADDVLGYLAYNLDGERWVVSGDKDLAVVVDPDKGIHHWRSGAADKNPFGDFSHKYIPVAIALVGDSSDKIPGARGFGEKALAKLVDLFGDEGLEMMQELILSKNLMKLQEDLGEMKELQKIIDDADNVYLSYELGRLRVEKINTLRRPLSWRVGMVKPRASCQDERLRDFAGTTRLVHASEYGEQFEFARKHIALSPYVTLDVETSTPPESDEWLEQAGKEDKVDVLGSKLTSVQMTFGKNLEYTVYLPVDNVEEKGIANLSIKQVADFVNLVPRGMITYAHNAAFELPVCYQAWGQMWANDQDYHGFLRNVRDTAIGSSYVDENRSRGLKSLSKDLLGYEQESYASVTTKEYQRAQWNGKVKVVAEWQTPLTPEGEVPVDEDDQGTPWVRVQYKMNELTARQVLAYGADDCICTAALANHFRTVMEIEKTWHIYEAVETHPAYLTALAFVQGTPISLEDMRAMEKEDHVAYDAAAPVLRQYLIDIGFDGTQCPVFDELSPANIKLGYEIINGEPMPKNLTRTLSKLAKSISEYADDYEQAGKEDEASRTRVLAGVVAAENLEDFNKLVKQYFSGEPQLDLASPKQMRELLYTHMQLPIKVINDVTPLQRQNNPDLADAVKKFKGIRAGSSQDSLTPEQNELMKAKAKTDDTAIDFALAFDADRINDAAKAALKAIGTMKRVMTRRSLFYKNYWTIKHWKDGLVHAQANQCAAVTRRYSMSNPNLQQLPKKGEAVRFRGIFRPHMKNAVVASIDFVGQELRLAAARSQDKNMLACYVGDKLKDIHSITAAGAMRMKWGKALVDELFVTYGADLPHDADGTYELFLRLRKLGKNVPIGKQADDLRKDAKNVNFGAQNGAKAVKLSETLVMELADAQLFLDARSAMFPDVDVAAERAAEDAKTTGYALTFMGARRHLRDAMLSDDRSEGYRAARQAWNYEIQGSAGEMTKLAMARLWTSGIYFRYRARFIAPIHDELVSSVHKDDAVAFLKEKNACMTQPYADMQIPILGSISIGPDFADQSECGDWFVKEDIEQALSDIFEMKAAA